MVGENAFCAFLPELLALLPDIAKQNVSESETTYLGFVENHVDPKVDPESGFQTKLIMPRVTQWD